MPGAHLTITIALLRGQKRYSAVNQASIAYAALAIGATVCFGAFAGVTGVCLGWLIGVALAAGVASLIAARRPETHAMAKSGGAISLKEIDELRAA